MKAPSDVYETLLLLVKDKDYFVLTTNVDHQFFRMMEAQGFVRDENGVFQVPERETLKMEVPSELIPKCPDDGSDMTINLRSDDTFAQDDGWYAAQNRYQDFIRRHEQEHVLYMELGVGGNTPRSSLNFLSGSMQLRIRMPFMPASTRARLTVRKRSRSGRCALTGISDRSCSICF